MWFDSWADVGRIVTVGSAAYLTVVVVLRFSGKRTLSKLNAFDLVVTVALGSVLATILLNSSVAWTDGAVALALLAVLQMVVATVASRLPATRAVLTARPTCLLRDGQLLEDALRAQRMTAGEVRQAIRTSGRGSLTDVAAVVLESDGSLSVIGHDQVGDGSALVDVRTAGDRDSSGPAPDRG